MHNFRCIPNMTILKVYVLLSASLWSQGVEWDLFLDPLLDDWWAPVAGNGHPLHQARTRLSVLDSAGVRHRFYCSGFAFPSSNHASV